MILYFHGFDATSPGNHEKMRQLQFVDDDVRLVSYSTLHPKNDMRHLLNEVRRMLQQCTDPTPIAIGVGLGGYWAERIGFLNQLKTVLINPNIAPQNNMVGKINRPEEYVDIADKCIEGFRSKSRGNALCILSRNDETNDNRQVEQVLAPFYDIIWDEEQSHKFVSLAAHLAAIKVFKDDKLIT